MKSLVIGMGIGALYLNVLTELGHEVITVDPVKLAHYPDVSAALTDHSKFDCVFICTPNWTHEEIAYNLADHAKIVFVEKPGFKDAARWQTLTKAKPFTKFMMVKNNQYREEITFFKMLKDRSKSVEIKWINKNRVPNPGTWFTDKQFAFGGVSRDLMPHLLSICCALDPDICQVGNIIKFEKQQRWSLTDVGNTDYGTVKTDGVYDVDDYCHFELHNKVRFDLTADWRSMDTDDQSITFQMDDRPRMFNLGLCPEIAYKSMIEAAIENLNNKDFWNTQLEQDLWIHKMIDQ